jgi:hypothetical protein
MDACEPRVRHRGLFVNSDTTGESDHTVEQENPEGFVIRTRIRRPTAPRRLVSQSQRSTGRRPRSNRDRQRRNPAP